VQNGLHYYKQTSKRHQRGNSEIKVIIPQKYHGSDQFFENDQRTLKGAKSSIDFEKWICLKRAHYTIDYR